MAVLADVPREVLEVVEACEVIATASRSRIASASPTDARCHRQPAAPIPQASTIAIWAIWDVLHQATGTEARAVPADQALAASAAVPRAPASATTVRCRSGRMGISVIEDVFKVI